MSGQKDEDERAAEVGGSPADPERDSTERERDRRRFEEDLETRGEAARADDEGNLPPGATHEIEDDGTVKRRRYSAS